MLYFDTSFLVPLLIPEDTSEQVESFFHALGSGETLTVSQWTRVELASVLSRLVRMGQLAAPVATECAVRFERLLDESFEVRTPSVNDFERCWNILTRFDSSLRTGDALHLSIAANMGVETVYSLDDGLRNAGKLLGIPVDRGID